MSHLKERAEKICLNCYVEVQGRFCHACGQENTEPKETVWTLMSHFFNDITHFDGKFFSTVKYLITKPGFLSAEYIRGRRASYLHPIRMYVFTAAFFFIIFFAFYQPEAMLHGNKNDDEQLKELSAASQTLKEKLPNAEKDTVLHAAIKRAISNIDSHALQLQLKVAAEGDRDSARLLRKHVIDSVTKEFDEHPELAGQLSQRILKLDSLNHQKKRANSEDLDFGDDEFSYHSQLAYDSVQKELPEKRKANWFGRAMTSKVIVLNTKYKDDKREGLAVFLEKFMHSLPQALFVSLPIFALLLLMLYARRSFYYAEHAIFTIHLYCATFILLLFVFGIEKFASVTGFGWMRYLELIFMLGIFFYLYKAMRRFYGQGRGKTILKLLLLNICSFFIVSLLAGLFFMLSVVRFS